MPTCRSCQNSVQYDVRVLLDHIMQSLCCSYVEEVKVSLSAEPSVASAFAFVFVCRLRQGQFLGCKVARMINQVSNQYAGVTDVCM